MTSKTPLIAALCLLALILTVATAHADPAAIEETDAAVDQLFRKGKTTGGSLIIIKYTYSLFSGK